MRKPQTKLLKLYTPHEAQKKFHESKSRYKVFVAGRQVGKSSACLNELVRKAWENPGTAYWYLSPTYPQAVIQYRKLISMLWPCHEVLLKKNQTELRMKFINQSEIIFKSAEVAENLRGATLHGVVLDEVREMPKEIWSMIIQPMLATTSGWAVFASTPSGFDSFYDIAERARSDATGQWSYFHAPSTCNPLFTQEEFERLKGEMSAAEFDQEIMAEFRDMHAGKAYLNFSNDNITDQFIINPDRQLSPHLPILVALDFNISPMSWCLGQVRGENFYFFDEISLKNSHTQEAAKELVQRVIGHPAGVLLVGDATSNARQRAAAGKSDYSIIEEILSANGIHYENRTPDSNPGVKDRVNIVNAKLKDATGNPHLWMHPRCVNLIRDFQRVSWKEGAQATLDQAKDPMLTHMSDAVGYSISQLSRLWQPSPGTLRVLIR